MKIQLSWFQKIVLVYIVAIFFLQGYIAGSDIFYTFGYAFGIGIIIFLLMWLFNKYAFSKIKIKNEVLIKSWLIIRFILAALIFLEVLLFVASFSGWFG